MERAHDVDAIEIARRLGASYFFALLSAVFVFTAKAQVESPPETSDAGSAEAGPLAETTIQALEQRTAQVEALIRGDLDLSVDPKTLFTLQMDSSNAADDIELLLAALEAPGQGPPAKSAGDPAERARRELASARAKFLSLSRERREQILAAHRARRRSVAEVSGSDKAKRRYLEVLKEEASHLEALLNGSLDRAIEPWPLLDIDLVDRREIAIDSDRRQQFLAPLADGASVVEDATSDGDLDAQLATQRRRLDALRRQFLNLDEGERGALLASHGSRISTAQPSSVAAAEIAEAKEAAQEAASDRREALVDSKLAQTEAMRLLATRRADLLMIKEAQAHFEADLASARGEIEQSHERVLAWGRRARELEARRSSNPELAREADGLYLNLIGDLGQARRALRATLDTIQEGKSSTPKPTDAGLEPLPMEIDDGTVRQLRDELDDAARNLSAAEVQLRWDRAAALRDQIVEMNKVRLRLFDMLSEKERHKLEGFGREGVQQVRRELEQMTLEARYHLLSFPVQLRAQARGLREASGAAVFNVFQIILLVLLFRWWRRRADEILENTRRDWLRRRPQTVFHRAVASLAWYARRVRKPLEWLIFFAVLMQILSEVRERPETVYLRIVVLWGLVGALVVRWVDAIASRQGTSSESAAKLRFRSIRTVGVTVVAIGLFMTLTGVTVGQGAIYAWVVRSLGIVVFILFTVLVVWWAQTIFERSATRQEVKVMAWVSDHKRGFLRFPAAAVGGVYLLAQGVARFVMRQVDQLAVTRVLFAYLLRRGVEKQASSKVGAAGAVPISESLYEAMGPSETTDPILVTAYASEKVHSMRAFVRSQSDAIVAIVGERGLGKTTFLRRVTSDLDSSAVCRVQCAPGGFAALLRSFASALGLPRTASEADVLNRLNARPPTVISVDDAQRLVRPMIGGLEDIDQLIRFTRLAPQESSWLIALGTPAWQYLKRARGDRAAFDRVVDLPEWSESQIASLLKARCAEACVEPSFDRIVVPRQAQSLALDDKDRNERDFYRMVWDYSDGNPAIALHFWRQSLYLQPPDEAIYVRLLQGPSTADLEDLATTAYFVLRTVVQLELATEEDVVACTDLDADEVADALRAAKLRGYIVERDQLYEVSIQWYRAITNILRRKHLLLM